MVALIRRLLGSNRPSEAELLSSSSVHHLKTMPGTDVVLGTMYTDPLAPPDEDPEAFYEMTPEAAPRRLRAPEQRPLDGESWRRLRTALLEKLDARSHQRTWMAVSRCTSWEGFRELLGEELPTTDGATLTLTWPSLDQVAVIWAHPQAERPKRVQLNRGVHW